MTDLLNPASPDEPAERAANVAPAGPAARPLSEVAVVEASPQSMTSQISLTAE